MLQRLASPSGWSSGPPVLRQIICFLNVSLLVLGTYSVKILKYGGPLITAVLLYLGPVQYDLSHRVPTFDLWMLAPQERKVVFHEHSLQKLARVTMAENAHRGEEKEVALHDETPDRMASSLNRRQRDAYNACKEIVKGNQVLLLMCGGPGTGACAGFLFVALP